MALTEFRGLRVGCESWGEGRALLALHAGGSSGAQWQRVAALLQDRHRVIAPDLIGSGRTEAWPRAGELSHDLQADLVAAVIEAEAVAPVDVVGHSYGGGVAMRLLLRRPDLVRSLLLIEPMLAVLLREAGDPLFEEYRSLAQGFIDQARAGRGEAAWALFLDYRNGPGTWAGMSDKSRARFLAQTVQTADGFASNLGNPTTLAECRGIAAPTTIACGTETTVPDRRVAELLRDAVAGNRFAPIPGAGHMSPLTRPEEVARIILAHLAEVGGPPAVV